MKLVAVVLLAIAPVDTPRPYLTPDGWGPVRIGMSRAEVEAVMGTPLEGEAINDEYSCIEMTPADSDLGVWFMFEEHKLSRISIAEPSKVRTPRGIGIGASATAVRRAYGGGLKAEPHFYAGLPSEYLTFWTIPGKRGVRFETDSKRRVQAIHAGGHSIQYVEGCA